ncbi:MaoC/PaaZ C-terminal domain-containing protein [Kitasatospora paranensis]|uniref:MaoC/PaaZ C-terminal domain-containing protein n=1 Tax=Kitasatospora paranensis TaxID=258053 RepID=A0ABW2FW20_9ACTN
MSTDTWYWEDLKTGQVFTSPGRTVTETDIVNFAGLSGDYNEVHVNAAYAESTAFGERIAHGILGLSIASGLFTRTELVLRIQSNLVALLGLEWKFTGPVLIGDTIRLEAEITDCRPTKDGKRGIIEVTRRVVNQRGEVVQIGKTPLMLLRRTEG